MDKGLFVGEKLGKCGQAGQCVGGCACLKNCSEGGAQGLLGDAVNAAPVVVVNAVNQTEFCKCFDNPGSGVWSIAKNHAVELALFVKNPDGSVTAAEGVEGFVSYGGKYFAVDGGRLYAFDGCCDHEVVSAGARYVAKYLRKQALG